MFERIRERVGNTVMADIVSDNKRNTIIIIVGVLILGGMVCWNLFHDEPQDEEEYYAANDEETSEGVATEPAAKNPFDDFQGTAWRYVNGDKEYYIVFKPYEYDPDYKYEAHLYSGDKNHEVEGRYTNDHYYSVRIDGNALSLTGLDGQGDLNYAYELNGDTLKLNDTEYKKIDTGSLVHISYSFGSGEDQEYGNDGDAPMEE